MTTETAPKRMFQGTAVKDATSAEGARALTEAEAAKVEEANRLIREAYDSLNEVFHSPMPVGRVQRLHISQVQANDYNPNSVAGEEMRLLHTSIAEDGYTQPVVAIWDDELNKAIIVDGFHRYTTMRRYTDIYEQTGGYLPVVVIDKPLKDRIASTVRHNRARGKHSVAGMGNLVFQMLEQGEDDATICDKLGLDPEELARLKHITGYSKLYGGIPAYSEVALTGGQMKEKAAYKAEHPDEDIPKW